MINAQKDMIFFLIHLEFSIFHQLTISVTDPMSFTFSSTITLYLDRIIGGKRMGGIEEEGKGEDRAPISSKSLPFGRVDVY